MSPWALLLVALTDLVLGVAIIWLSRAQAHTTTTLRTLLALLEEDLALGDALGLNDTEATP